MAIKKNIFSLTSTYSLSEDHCLEVIRQLYPKDYLKNKVVLDVGCRNGEYSSCLHNLGATVTGVDLNLSSIEFAKLSYPEISDKFHIMDIYDMSRLQENSFDIILCIGVLPYILPSKLNEIFEEMHRILKPEGELVLVFQKDKNILVNLISKFISYIPFKIYYYLVVKFSSYFLFFFLKRLWKRGLDMEYLQYGVLSSLHGIHFGYPQSIKPYIIEWKNIWAISDEMNVVAKVSKPNLTKLLSS